MAATEGSSDARMRSQRITWLPRRSDYTSETKPFFLTSEFLTLLATIAAIAIAMAASDNFDSPRGFTLIAGLAAAYMIARGLAKAGTKDPNPDRGDRY
jgi:hypothetical protein